MYDIAIIGAGPAGYVAAERAGEKGAKVLLTEQADHLGGECLNAGCIPTKSMLYSAKLFDHVKHADAFGVSVKDAAFDYSKVKARTEKVQDQLRKGILGLMKKEKVDVVKGQAVVLSPNKIAVDGKEFEAKNILICTGSSPWMPPVPGLENNPSVVTNRGLLTQTEMVNHLCIIGAGVIGTEFACLYAMAGKKVTVIEMLPQICGNMDPKMTQGIKKKLESKGVTFYLEAAVESVKDKTVNFKDSSGKTHKVNADLILVATGRAVNTRNLGLEALQVDMDRRGIKVNERAETNVPGIYAAGDVTGRWQLAHFASRQATVAVNNILGCPDICRESAIPAVVYTDPEIASVGLTEQDAKKKGIEVKTASMPMAASGRYLAETDGERGTVQVVCCAKRGTVLGIHMVGPYVSEMISTAVTIIETELRAQDVRELVFPHPTIGEIMRDVMFAVK